MDLREYENLPDKPEPAEIWSLTELALRESIGEPLSVSLAKLNEISDRQWHTYELPPEPLRAALRLWLLEHWQPQSMEFLENVLGLAYCYALDKEVYQAALAHYHGEWRDEFLENLRESAGDNIDPWWSLRGRGRAVMLPDSDVRWHGGGAMNVPIPPFGEAIRMLRELLRTTGFGGHTLTQLWLTREDFYDVRYGWYYHTSRPSCDPSMFNQYYEAGRSRGIVSVQAIFYSRGAIGCTVWFPQTEADEVQGWYSGLKVSVMTPLGIGSEVVSPLRWKLHTLSPQYL